jgi:tRNA nucleotidyltransferase (CCA-adding enzyme)
MNETPSIPTSQPEWHAASWFGGTPGRVLWIVIYGRADLDAHVLRHASDRFHEDPLRVQRGMQLAARFGLTAAPETVVLCKTLTQNGQPSERLWEEWKKLLLQGVKPSLGLQFLSDCG